MVCVADARDHCLPKAALEVSLGGRTAATDAPRGCFGEGQSRRRRGVLVTRQTPRWLNCAVPSVPKMEVSVSLPGGRSVSVAMLVSMVDGR